MRLPPPRPTLFPYTTLFRSVRPRSSAVAKPPVRKPKKKVCVFCTDKSAPSIDYKDTTMLRKTQTFLDRKSTRLNSSHRCISYAVFCLKKKNSGGKGTPDSSF